MTQEEILQVLGKSFNPFPWFVALSAIICATQAVQALPQEQQAGHMLIVFLVSIIVGGYLYAKETKSK